LLKSLIFAQKSEKKAQLFAKNGKCQSPPPLISV